ncbi:guanine nucleotide binding protein, alpha subunit [Mycena galericulata]|nr:guanine nucleotide binding protein, alpha subunit [Mycena galericulata]
MPRDEDPLDAVLRPPKDETAAAAAVRVAREEEARRVSSGIDAAIRAERQARRKKRIVRLLLLGQSESGKSTTLRQFQRLYTPTAFREERILWRAVIQLNIVRSITTILDALAPSQHRPRRPSGGSTSLLALSSPAPATTADITDTHNVNYEYGVDSDGGPQSDPDAQSDDYDSDPDAVGRFAHAPGPASPSHARAPSLSRSYVGGGGGGGGGGGAYDSLRLRLQPLRHVEALLIARLVPPGEHEPVRLDGAYNGDAHAYSSYANGNDGDAAAERDQTREIFVRPGNRWKGVGAAGMGARSKSPASEVRFATLRPTLPTPARPDPDPQTTLHALAPAMRGLWTDPGVRAALKRRRIRLEEGPGFFLNDLERVTALNYLPTDDDVLRARLKTVGVSEYTFEMEVSTGRETGTEWRIVDVGGSRTTWVPFFDDVDAIIFLAPISGFDQVLSEDRTINRLEDSVLLWKAVCSNKLLAGVDLVLFLNKCDILERKLKAGVRLARYVRSYADRENTFEAVSQYLRSKFSAIHREYSPNPRKFYAFCTSVTDTATTGGIIASVRDMVVRQHLKQSKLL